MSYFAYPASMLSFNLTFNIAFSKLFVFHFSRCISHSKHFRIGWWRNDLVAPILSIKRYRMGSNVNFWRFFIFSHDDGVIDDLESFVPWVLLLPFRCLCGWRWSCLYTRDHRRRLQIPPSTDGSSLPWQHQSTCPGLRELGWSRIPPRGTHNDFDR